MHVAQRMPQIMGHSQRPKGPTGLKRTPSDLIPWFPVCKSFNLKVQWHLLIGSMIFVTDAMCFVMFLVYHNLTGAISRLPPLCGVLRRSCFTEQWRPGASRRHPAIWKSGSPTLSCGKIGKSGENPMKLMFSGGKIVWLKSEHVTTVTFSPTKKVMDKPILRQSKMMARVILVPMAPKPSAKTQYEIYESIHLQWPQR